MPMEADLNTRLEQCFAVYSDDEKSAQDIAEIGVKAGVEFDNNSAPPISFHTLELM